MPAAERSTEAPRACVERSAFSYSLPFGPVRSPDSVRTIARTHSTSNSEQIKSPVLNRPESLLYSRRGASQGRGRFPFNARRLRWSFLKPGLHRSHPRADGVLHGPIHALFAIPSHFEFVYNLRQARAEISIHSHRNPNYILSVISHLITPLHILPHWHLDNLTALQHTEPRWLRTY